MLTTRSFCNYSLLSLSFSSVSLLLSMEAPLAKTPILVQENDLIGQLTLRAEKGDCTAAYALADSYSVGRNCARDQILAEQWFKKAGELGNPKALYRLGKIAQRQTRDMIVREKKLTEAASYYEQAAALQEPLSMYELALMFKPKGWGAKESLLYELQWLQKLMKVPFVSSVHDEDYAKTVKIVQAEGACRLGDISCEQNDPGCAEAYYKSATEFHEYCDEAWYKCALLYVAGSGVKKDVQEARKLLSHVNESYTPRHSALGHLCREEKQYEQAIKHYKQSVDDRGVIFPESVYGLGILFENGWGVEVDEACALFYFTQAAEKGHHLAFEKLRITYEDRASVKHLVAEITRKRNTMPCHNLDPNNGYRVPLLH